MNLQAADPEYSSSIEALPLQATLVPHWSDWFASKPHRVQWLIAVALLALAQVLFAGCHVHHLDCLGSFPAPS